MVFAYDTEVALNHAAALANTGPARAADDREDLPDLPALLGWLDRWDWTGARPSSEADVTAMRALRPRLRRLWVLRGDALVAETNALLSENRALPQLVSHPPLGWHVHATSDDAPPDRRTSVEIGMALIDVIRADEADRLRVCAGADCEDLFIDLSRNRSRKFCAGTCGTRANVAAYRARRAAASR
jgi:predicted RNA-binding Zn ribbon-like protein